MQDIAKYKRNGLILYSYDILLTCKIKCLSAHLNSVQKVNIETGVEVSKLGNIVK